MVTREDLLASMLHEINVVKYLAARIPPGRHNWRPSPGQRSVLELMRYLVRAGSGTTTTLINGNRDHFEALKARCEAVTPLTFDRAMDKQAEDLKRVLGGVSNARLANEKATVPWGGPQMSLGAAIMNTGVKFLTAYRMQLFLYIKQLGVQGISTSENWAGRDPAK
jgi:hypothetical protein